MYCYLLRLVSFTCSTCVWIASRADLASLARALRSLHDFVKCRCFFKFLESWTCVFLPNCPSKILPFWSPKTINIGTETASRANPTWQLSWSGLTCSYFAVLCWFMLKYGLHSGPQESVNTCSKIGPTLNTILNWWLLEAGPNKSSNFNIKLLETCFREVPKRAQH